MTHIEFYRELRRGKGSCFYEVQNDPDRYHNILMNAATRSTAYDQQCEGTRADYIYELLALTNNRPTYLAAAIAAIKEASPLRRNRAKPDTCADEDDEEPNFARNPEPCDDDFYFLAELLSLFAKDGYSEALSALILDYDKLFCHLLSLKERPDLFFPERDDFERLAILLCESTLVDPLLVLRDIGKLFENPIYQSYDFDQLHELVGIPHRDKLKAEKDDPAIARYLAIYYPTFSKNASEDECRHEEDFEDLMTEFLSEDPKKRAQNAHLPPDSRMGALDPHALMTIVDENPSPDTAAEALTALSKIRHPDVRKWALARLESDPEHYLPIVMKNYEDEDEFEVWYELKQVTVDPQNENGWHSVHLSLLSMKDDGLTPPDKALMFVYRHTYCSNCRLEAIKQLHRAKALTAEILTEALHDSNKDTRDFVKTILAE